MGIAPDLDERTQRDCGWLAGTFLDIVVDFIYSNLYFPGLFVGWVFSFARCLDATQLMTACNNNMLSVYLLMWLALLMGWARWIVAIYVGSAPLRNAPFCSSYLVKDFLGEPRG
jgi:hypothetical protein